MKKNTLTLLLLILFSFSIRAQITITGKVTDHKGKPLANIRIYNKDRNTQTYTDSLGN